MKQRGIKTALLATALATITSLAGCGKSQDTGIKPVYDHKTAFVLIEQQVPAERDSFGLFDLDAVTPVDYNARKLRKKLNRQSNRRHFIGLTGPDAKYNHAVLTAALHNAPAKLGGNLTLIYTGPASQRDAVRKLLDKHAVQLRYVVYP